MTDWKAEAERLSELVNRVLAMPFGPRPHASHEAPTGLRHPVSVAIAGTVR